MNDLDFNAALDRVIGYLADERDDYEERSPAERRNHIWKAVEVLIRHRAPQLSQST